MSVSLCPTVSWGTSEHLHPPPPTSFPKTGRQVSVPLMHLKAAWFVAAAVDKYWKRYPSLKHHAFIYCKRSWLWEPSSHCWQGERQHSDMKMQPQPQLQLQRRDCSSKTWTSPHQDFGDIFFFSENPPWYNQSSLHFSQECATVALLLI